MIYQCLISAYQSVFPPREVPWKGLAVKMPARDAVVEDGLKSDEEGLISRAI